MYSITEKTVGQVKELYQEYDFKNKNEVLIESFMARNPPNIYCQDKVSSKKDEKNEKMSEGEEDEEDVDDDHMIDKDIVCTEYAPDVFAKLRNEDGY